MEIKHQVYFVPAQGSGRTPVGSPFESEEEAVDYARSEDDILSKTSGSMEGHHTVDQVTTYPKGSFQP